MLDSKLKGKILFTLLIGFLLFGGIEIYFLIVETQVKHEQEQEEQEIALIKAEKLKKLTHLEFYFAEPQTHELPNLIGHINTFLAQVDDNVRIKAASTVRLIQFNTNQQMVENKQDKKGFYESYKKSELSESKRQQIADEIWSRYTGDVAEGVSGGDGTLPNYPQLLKKYQLGYKIEYLNVMREIKNTFKDDIVDSDAEAYKAFIYGNMDHADSKYDFVQCPGVEGEKLDITTTYKKRAGYQALKDTYALHVPDSLSDLAVDVHFILNSKNPGYVGAECDQHLSRKSAAFKPTFEHLRKFWFSMFPEIKPPNIRWELSPLEVTEGEAVIKGSFYFGKTKSKN